VARVLVIDDDRALLQALRTGLSALGYEVSAAMTGEDGLSKSDQRRCFSGARTGRRGQGVGAENPSAQVMRPCGIRG
jgi:CheY-like chemotaxis protein